MTPIPLTKRAHGAIAKVLSGGSIAIDATIGNGYDTLFLASCVGKQGHVYGFDIQKSAITTTQRRLGSAGLGDRVSLYQTGHERMGLILPTLTGRVTAVMFNLGYLPGNEKSLITHSTTTLAALHSALMLLAPQGCISVLAYTGHPGGRKEAEDIKRWADLLPSTLWRVMLEVPSTLHGNAPEWLLIERRSPPTSPG